MKIGFVGNARKEMYIFRGDIIKYLKEEGHDVSVIVPFTEYNYNIYGVKEIFLDVERKGINPIKDFIYFLKLMKIYKREKYDIIFHYSIKPNIYGSLASYLAKIKSISVITGLGYVFLHNDIKSKIARLLYRLNIKYAHRVWFLNEDDKKDFLKSNIIKENKAKVIPGEGINTEYFKPIHKDKTDDKIVFLLISRLLTDKGIYEYFEVAKRLKHKYNNIEFQLLGYLDKDNPSCIDKNILDENIDKGIINYLGVSNDVREQIKEVDCVILPSYREGISRTLMEAMSMEKPIITTNAVGCKELIKDGFNGFVCEPKSVESLIEAMEKFINLNELERKKQGENGRLFIEEKFNITRIIGIYIKEIE